MGGFVVVLVQKIICAWNSGGLNYTAKMSSLGEERKSKHLLGQP